MVTEENIDTKTSPADTDSTSAAKVLVLRDYCVRHCGADCERCAIACPHDAISFTEQELPVIDADRCSACGICFGICDAFSSNKVTLLDLHERVKRIALTGDKPYFTCPENLFEGLIPASNVIVLPCLAALPPQLWALILSENITATIACDLSYCIGCERAGEYAETLYKHSIKTAEDWTGKQVRLAKEIPEKKYIIKDVVSPVGVDRRGVFTNLIDDVSDIASGKRRLRNSEVLQNFFIRQEKSRAIARLNLSECDEINRFAPLGRTKKTLFPKRKMLLQAIELDPSIAEKAPVYLAEIKDPHSALLKDCASKCPTGALAPDPETGAISIEKRYCVACGICVNIAGDQVIEMIESNASAIVDIDIREGEENSHEEHTP